MKTMVAIGFLMIFGAFADLRAGQPQPWQKPPPAPPQLPVPIIYTPASGAVPVTQPVPTPVAPPVYVYNQNLWTRQYELVSDAKAQEIVDEFRANYPKLGSPRFRVEVNHSAGQTAAALADRQTFRDVERLMGRPLGSAGATLVDARYASAATLSPTNTEAGTTGADVAIEVLISSRNVPVAEVDGVRNYSVPDIQMTAIRLKDGKIIGQSTAADVINKAGGPAVAAKNFTVQDITEVTTLALMDDINQRVK